jgi:putative transposase
MGMARHPRLNVCGGTYHVMNRGNRKAPILEDDRDRKRFVSLLIRLLRSFDVEFLLGCLMGNHFHLIVTTPQGNLSAFMQQLEGQFAMYSNWRHKRVGHLFQGRFKGVLIENDIHLLTATCYVFLNPVVARFCNRPEEWKWSSYAAIAGLAAVPDYLSIRWVETLFPTASLTESQKCFRECMNDPQPIQAYLRAVDSTIDVTIASYVSDRLHDVAQPCPYRTLMRPPLAELFSPGQDRTELTNAIALAYETHGFRIAEIARHIGLHPATISKYYCSTRGSK